MQANPPACTQREILTTSARALTLAKPPALTPCDLKLLLQPISRGNLDGGEGACMAHLAGVRDRPQADPRGLEVWSDGKPKIAWLHEP